MAAKRKCHICGEELHSINRRGLEYSVVLQNAKGSYHLCGRMKWNEKWSMLLSEQEDNPRIYSRPHPLCPSCFLKKLRRAIVALETALEGKGIDPDDETEEVQEEQPKAKQEIIVPSAEEIKRDYPEWVNRVTKAHHGVPLEGESLREIFRMQRKIGAV